MYTVTRSRYGFAMTRVNRLIVAAIAVLAAGALASTGMGLIGTGRLADLHALPVWDIPGRAQQVEALMSATRWLILSGLVMLAAVGLATVLLLVELSRSYAASARGNVEAPAVVLLHEPVREPVGAGRRAG